MGKDVKATAMITADIMICITVIIIFFLGYLLCKEIHSLSTKLPSIRPARPNARDSATKVGMLFVSYTRFSNGLNVSNLNIVSILYG